MSELKMSGTFVSFCNNSHCNIALRNGDEVVLGENSNDLYCSYEHYVEVLQGVAKRTRIRRKTTVGTLEVEEHVLFYC